MKINKILSFALALSASVPAAQAYDIHVESGFYNYSGSSQRSVYLTYASLQDNLEAYKGDVVIPASITYNAREIPVKGVGDHALINCQYVTSVILPEGVTYILDQAFSHCYYMRGIQLPATLEKIGDFAFEFCEDMGDVTIPASVSEFGYAVFTYCKGIRAFNVAEGSTILETHDGALFNKGGEILIQYPAGNPATEYEVPAFVTTVTDYAFTPAPNLQTITFGDGVKALDSGIFAECPDLKAIVVSEANESMTAPGGVLFTKDLATLIAYPSAREAQEYEVGEGTKTIVDMAFMNSLNLAEITLPESLTSLGSYVFVGCLPNSITVKAVEPPTTGLDPFDPRMYNSTTLYVPEAALEAYKSSPVWKTFKKIETIESGAIESIATGSGFRFDNGTITAPGSIEVYTPDGRQVASGMNCLTLPGRGLYIIRTGAKTYKTVW